MRHNQRRHILESAVFGRFSRSYMSRQEVVHLLTEQVRVALIEPTRLHCFSYLIIHHRYLTTFFLLTRYSPRGSCCQSAVVPTQIPCRL